MIPDKLQKIFQSVLAINYAVKEDMTRGDIPEWDSINNLNLIVELEDQYNISFSIEEIEKIGGVADILSKIGV